MKKNNLTKIVLLGSTGSIGIQTLNVCRRLDLKVEALACYKNIDLIYQQIQEFKPNHVAVVDARSAKKLRERLKRDKEFQHLEILTGNDGLVQLAQLECDRVVMAIIGFAALEPLLAAIKQGQKIAMANKETIVAMGDFIISMVKEHHAEILPVDSELSAIWQCVAHNSNPIEKVILTASGGPFRNLPKSEFAKITVEDALNHPVWSMGDKITIDSATMMNKGLEMIEISHLFQLDAKQIEIIVQPEGIIHSMVEFVDGAILAQMGLPDMELPIQYAITFDQRLPMPDKPKLDFASLAQISFFEPDYEKFPALKLSFFAKMEAGAMPAVLNASNEIAVAAFFQKKIRFDQIPQIIETTLDRFAGHHLSKGKSISEILLADEWAREEAKNLVQRL
ncbi:MAG: 1-deoxy-D-xylulose-5-phosphate reductoisomerase [Clostridiaceae bacterium]|nr:1-deoxy-D-xylulose-5-phosphate reductoisomerase [Clostridiaceae bacterium]